MPSKKKKYNSRFPPARIKKIMQADEEVGKVAAVVPVIISRTLEIFVESLLKQASHVTRSRNARTLTPAHLKASILGDNQFAFLKDVVQAIPDIQPVGEEDQQEAQPSGVSTIIKAPPKRSRSSTAPVQATNSPRRRGRPRKTSLVNRSAERPVDDDDEEEDEEDDEDTADDEEEGSSCDNSNPSSSAVRPSVIQSAPFLPSLPLPSRATVLQHIDDDYDA